MQRLFPVPGGINAYVTDPSILSTEANRACPFCVEPHRLRLHGSYLRWVICPDPAVARRITVLRFLCSKTGKTLSLLPDFCVPKRQYGPEVLALFLSAWVSGKSILAAMRECRSDVTTHSVGQSLLSGVRRRAGRLRGYLTAHRLNPIEPPAAASASRREIADVVLGLIGDAACAAAAFVSHGVLFHAESQLGLA